MNNHLFVVARFLRDRGLDAHLLLVDDEYEHFHPSHDAYDRSYESYTHRLTWGSARSFFRTGRRRVARDLRPYDAIIGCGFAPAFCERAGRTLDAFIPYGADLYLFPFGVSRDRRLRRVLGGHLARYQRRGIARARRVYCLDTYETYRRSLERLGVAYEPVGLTFVYYPAYEGLVERANLPLQFRSTFDALRDQASTMVFSHTRHFWTGDPLGRSKGNDLLIRGFARCARDGAAADALLVLFEYGRDVEASKALCRELGIADRVRWLEPMPRREIMYGAALSDIGADQFPGPVNRGGYASVAVELMGLGKPVLGQLLYGAEEFQRRAGFPPPPLLNVSDADPDAGAQLEQVLAMPASERAGAGERSRAWAHTHHGSATIDRYVAGLG